MNSGINTLMYSMRIHDYSPLSKTGEGLLPELKEKKRNPGHFLR